MLIRFLDRFRVASPARMPDAPTTLENPKNLFDLTVTDRLD